LVLSTARKSPAHNRCMEITTGLRLRVSCALLLAVGATAILTGCAGVSAGSNNQVVSNPNPTPGTLSAAPTTLAFGNVTMGSSASLTGTLSATIADVSVSSASVTGTGYSISGISFPLTIPAGQSANYTVTFTPAATGSAPGAVTFASNASDPSVQQAFSGSGAQTGPVTGTLAVTPASLNFGNVVVGSSSSLTARLSATNANVVISSADWTGSGYTVSGITFPVTVTVGQTTRYTVTFTPQSAGSAPGNISFASNATNASLQQTFTGSGTSAPPQHSVALTWDPSTSTVSGYNIYRGTQSGGPYTKLNSALLASTSFNDSGVQAGSTYFYVSTAVDSNSVESAFSNEANATVPTP